MDGCNEIENQIRWKIGFSVTPLQGILWLFCACHCSTDVVPCAKFDIHHFTTMDESRMKCPSNLNYIGKIVRPVNVIDHATPLCPEWYMSVKLTVWGFHMVSGIYINNVSANDSLIGACSVPIHYLNLCWLIQNGHLRINLSKTWFKTKLLCLAIGFENVTGATPAGSHPAFAPCG